jgi:hypothetical protein
MKLYSLLPLILALPLAAQTPKPTSTLPPTLPSAAAKPVPPPVISDRLRADFFKAQSQAMQSSQMAKDSQASLQAIVAELQKTCGDKYTLQLNSGGDPECAARPVPAKEAK